MKLFEIGVLNGAETEGVVFVVADVEETATRIARAEFGGNKLELTVLGTADAVPGMAPRVIARRRGKA